MYRLSAVKALVCLVLLGGCGFTDADRVEEARNFLVRMSQPDGDDADEQHWEYLVSQRRKAVSHIDRTPSSAFAEPYLVSAMLSPDGVGDKYLPSMVVQFVELGFTGHGVRLTNTTTDEQLVAHRVFDWEGQREGLALTALRHSRFRVYFKPEGEAESATREWEGGRAIVVPQEWIADDDAIEAEVIFDGGSSNRVPVFVRTEKPSSRS